MFGFFKKNNKPEINETPDENSVSTQIAFLKENNWIWPACEFDIKKDNILIMDDRPEIISSVIDDLRSLDASDVFHLDRYNLITVTTRMAGFQVLEILEKAPNIEIHYAILDIILGGKQVINDKRVMVDGVDIALKIYEKFPEAEIIFFTGCILENTDDPSHFKNKFKKSTGEDILSHILPKDISFKEELAKLSTFFSEVTGIKNV